MIASHFIEFVALALALTGFGAVVWEIARKDVRLFGEIASDVRAMAERRAPAAVQPFKPASVALTGFANNNETRKAA